MIFLSVPLVVLEWLLGGQINKIIRPIAIPLTIIGIYLLHHNHSWWCVLPALIYGFELTLGYGDNSRIKKYYLNDESVRLEYSSMCCLPVILCSLLTRNYSGIIGVLLVLGAFQIRGGSIGKIGKYDILLVDIFRGLSIGVAMAWALI